MVCCSSASTHVTFDLNDALRDLAEYMRLTDSELRRLFAVFCRMDRARRGKITSADLYRALDLQPSKFLDAVFTDIDTDRDQHWSFLEWMTALCKLNLSTHDRLAEYMFTLFDTQNAGYIAGDDLHDLLNAAHGEESMYPLPLDQAAALYDEKHDGKLDLIEFRTALQFYPVLIWPMFEMQIRMQTAVLGTEFWQRMFVRVHPDLERRYYHEIGDDIQEAIAERVERVADVAAVCLPWLRKRQAAAKVPEVNLAKHNMEKEKIRDEAAKAGIVFDGIEAVAENAESQKHDSEEEIEELTDDENFDVAMYLPKNASPNTYMNRALS